MDFSMRPSTACFLSCVVLALPFATSAQVDLRAFDKNMYGSRTQILVLGSVHLSELHDFHASSLDGLIARLAAFKPQVITIEAISGEQCDMASRNAVDFGPYCHRPEAAKAATGLDIPAALAKINETLNHWPQTPSPTDRRRLAAYFLAAGDTASAYVQWLQLVPSEQHEGDGLDATLVSTLKGMATTKDEGYQIAARLAARLRLQRVYPVDDHTGDNIQVDDAKAFGGALEKAWHSDGGVSDESHKHENELKAANDLLPLYRYLNLPSTQQISAHTNVALAMTDNAPERYAQIWVRGWEIRNLRMVSNVMETVRERPGARVLSIIGSSHKPWFENWLAQFQGVEMVDAELVLK